MFLNEVIYKTNDAIKQKTDFLMRTRETRKKELDAQKQELLDTLSTTTKTKEEEFSKTSKAFVKTYVTSSLDYSYNPWKNLQNWTNRLQNIMRK